AGAQFGVPIARTLGNCLSAANLRRLCATLGVSWVKRMLLLAEMPTAESLLPTGYLEAVVPQEALDAEVARLCHRLLGHAPLTIAATREALRRLAPAADVDIADLIRACYGSTDFRRGVGKSDNAHNACAHLGRLTADQSSRAAAPRSHPSADSRGASLMGKNARAFHPPDPGTGEWRFGSGRDFYSALAVISAGIRTSTRRVIGTK